jgi:hypothetical protein
MRTTLRKMCVTATSKDLYVATKASPSLKERVSRDVQDTLLACMPDDLGSPLVFNDVIYWLQGFSRMILCFDTKFSLFNLLTPPPAMGVWCNHLLEINGLLSIATIGQNKPTVDVRVQQPTLVSTLSC